MLSVRLPMCRTTIDNQEPARLRLGGLSIKSLEEDVIKPRGKPPTIRFCRECGHPYYPSRADQDFCLPKHRKEFHKRRSACGALLYDAGLKWRGERAKGSMKEFCQILDPLVAEEKARRRRNKEVREHYNRSRQQ